VKLIYSFFFFFFVGLLDMVYMVINNHSIMLIVAKLVFS
jgi:hypothetical protein